MEIFTVFSKDPVSLTGTSNGFCLCWILLRRNLTQPITRAPTRATNINAEIDKAMMPARDSPGSAIRKTILNTKGEQAEYTDKLGPFQTTIMELFRENS